YVLAMAYRAGEIALADASWDEAVAKFTAVQTADPLYLSWLPERAPRRRRAETQVAWGRALLADRQLSEAEQHCEQARQADPELPAAAECLAAIAAMRTPTATPTATPTPTRSLPIAPPRAPAPPRPPAPPPSPQATTDTVPRAPAVPSSLDQQAPRP